MATSTATRLLRKWRASCPRAGGFLGAVARDIAGGIPPLVLALVTSACVGRSEPLVGVQSDPDPPPSSSPQETSSTSPSATGATLETLGGICSGDADCESAFCDLGSCQEVDEQNAYGISCAPPPIGPYGTPSGKSDACPYVCVEGRCRACTSAEQCFDLKGYPGCAPSGEGRPGSRCVGEALDGGTFFVPPLSGTITAGTLVEGVADSIDCAAGNLDLSGLSPQPGWKRPRLAVVWWHQRIGEYDEFAHIGYDVALSAEQFSLSFTDVELPFEENLICDRACRDRSECDCLGEPALALGSILIAQDVDGDARLSVDEVRAEQVAGASDRLIGWSPSSGVAPPEWRGTLDSTVGGTCAYEYSRLPTASALSPVGGETGVVWSTCPADDTGCDFEVPELFCLWGRCESDRGLDRFGL
jgi:hypothetical protein